MLSYKSVRGTQHSVLPLERDEDKVYVRTNIKRVDEPDSEDHLGFHGWEYDETIYSHLEYTNKLEVDIEKSKSDSLTAMEGLAELYESLLGGGV